jgi:outer membrane murein-binding lipoprotein Lpp
MEIRGEKNELDRRYQDVNSQSDQIEQDINDLTTKCQRAQQSRDSKFNNVKAVKGTDFEEQPAFS